MDDELTLAEAARAFGILPATVRKAVERGRLQARKVGPIYVVKPGAVRDWLATGNHNAGRPRKDGGPMPAPATTPPAAASERERDAGAHHSRTRPTPERTRQ